MDVHFPPHEPLGTSRHSRWAGGTAPPEEPRPDAGQLAALIGLLGRVMELRGGRGEQRRALMAGLCRMLGGDVWGWIQTSSAACRLGAAQAAEEELLVAGAMPVLPPAREQEMKRLLRRFACEIGDVPAEKMPAPRGRRPGVASGAGLVRSSNPARALRVWRRADGFVPLVFLARTESGGLIRGVGICRPVTMPEFSETETALVRTLLREIPWLLESERDAALAGSRHHPRGTPADTLHPRLREILGMLVCGLPRKTIAADLGLSLNTVHGYVRDIYHHFQVNSQPELMARHAGRDGGL